MAAMRIAGCFGAILSMVVLLAAAFLLVGASPMPSTAPGGSPWPTTQVLIVQLANPDGSVPDDGAISDAVVVLGARMAAYGIDVTLTPIPDARIRIEVGDAARMDALAHLVTAPGELLFVPVPPSASGLVLDDAPLPSEVPNQPLFDGTHIIHAEVSEDPTGQPAVDFQFDQEAADLFDRYAEGHQGEQFAMVLDGIVMSAPVVNASHFNGHAQVTGAFDVQTAKELAAILQGGVLTLDAHLLTVCPAAPACPVPSPGPSVSPAA